MRPTEERDGAGQDAWFRELWKTHYDAVLGYVARQSDLETARDVMNDAFVVVWRKPGKVPAEPDGVRPWLYRVAQRQLANRRRSRQRAENLTARLGGALGIAPHGGNPEDAVVEMAPVVQALNRLSRRDQEILRLIGWEELNLAEAAMVLHCSPAAAATRLHRARRRLERVLEEIDHSGAAVNTTGASATVVEEKR